MTPMPRTNQAVAAAGPQSYNHAMAESHSLSFDLPDEAATRAFAERLAHLARPGDVIALRGDLGMGKTTLARAFIRALTSPGEEVPSPTFTLVQTYETADAQLWHFDLYRLEQPEDACELDIDDAFAEGISLIEWPDRLGRLLPGKRLDMTLLPGKDAGARRVQLTGGGMWADRLKELGA